MTYDAKPVEAKAVLVGVTLPDSSDEETEESLAELARLVKTLGYEVVQVMSQRRGSLSGGAVLGAGKLLELGKMTGGSGVLERRGYAKKSKVAQRKEEQIGSESTEQGAPDIEHLSFDMNPADIPQDHDYDSDFDEVEEDPEPIAQVVVFDCELTPSQLSNLQRATGAQVFDRTGVIVEIFSRHAKTRAAKLQVEMARLRYLAPRVRLTGTGPGDKLGKAGEKTLELDKRRIRDRIAELKKEISSIEKEQSNVRSSRSQLSSVALVGYTNAGKSSMMRALTGSSVLVEDKLFATLDTTIRALYPASVPRILISDTVGFINKLPTDLVASFRSTLEEAKNAAQLLFVVDASDPAFRSQLHTTRHVLKSIGANELPSHLVLNKIDKLKAGELEALQQEFPDALSVSTKSKSSMAWLREQIIEYFEEDMVEEDVFIPYTTQGAIGRMRSTMRVLAERHTETGTYYTVRSRTKTLEKLRESLEDDDSVEPHD